MVRERMGTPGLAERELVIIRVTSLVCYVRPLSPCTSAC